MWASRLVRFWFISRLAKDVSLEQHVPIVPEDVADTSDGNRHPYFSENASDPDLVIYRLSGAFFFGAASAVSTVLDRIADQRKSFVLDFSAVPFLNSTAANIMDRAARKGERAKIQFSVPVPRPPCTACWRPMEFVRPMCNLHQQSRMLRRRWEKRISHSKSVFVGTGTAYSVSWAAVAAAPIRPRR